MAAKHARSTREVGKSPALALVFVLIGGFIMMIAAGVVPFEGEASDAPPFVVGLAGFTFVAAGGAFLVNGGSAARAVWAMLIMACMAGIGLWVAFFGDTERISGGIPFLPQETNAAIGKVMFGLGALITLLMIGYAFKDALRRSRKEDGT